MSFFGYPAGKQVAYGVSTPYPYPQQPYPPQPYPPQPYPQNPNSRGPAVVIYTNQQTLGSQFMSAQQQQQYPVNTVSPANSYIPQGPGMLTGQQYAIPVLGMLQFAAIQNYTTRIEKVGGSLRIEGLSKLRYYNIEVPDVTSLTGLEARWAPDTRIRSSIYQLNARRIFLTATKLVDGLLVTTRALFTRCNQTTEMLPYKNYLFYRGCYRFTEADSALITTFQNTGFFCDDPLTPRVNDRTCIEDESIDYVARFGGPIYTIPPNAVTSAGLQ